MKLLEENIGVHFHDFGWGKVFSATTQKAKVTKGKIKTLSTLNLCTSKDII